MYRRPILCTLHGAVDFLNVLKNAVVVGGGGRVLLVHSEIYYVPVDDGWDQVLVRNVLHYIPELHPGDKQYSKFASAGNRTRVACLTGGHST
jgi:hypothetical protein